MQIETAKTDPPAIYACLGGLVAPRPIAWVTTISTEGVVNLAPFSFFNLVSTNPPVLVFSPSLKRDGSKKDTLRNLEANGEFVVNGSVDALVNQINLSSRELPPDQSEIEATGLGIEPSTLVKTPRVAESPFALECRVRQVIPLGTEQSAGNLVIGDIVMIHVKDEYLDANGRPDPRKLRSLARLGGDFWCRATDLFELKRPI